MPNTRIAQETLRAPIWLKADLHTHTAEDPVDGGRMVVTDAETLVREAAAAGFQVLSITNHNQLYYPPDLVRFAADLGVVLIPGVEATIDGRHLLLYNFLDYRPDWVTIEQVRRSKGPGQLVIVPHPFYPVSSAARDRFHQWIDVIDAVELSFLFMKGLNFNIRARREAVRAGLPLVANNDLHFLFQLGMNYSEICADPAVESVIDAVKRGQVRPVTGSSGFWFMARWFAAMLASQTRFALGSDRRLSVPRTE